jgi:hypothetical protein
MSKQNVHRRLSVNTPYLKGADIELLQKYVNRQFKHFKIDRRILADGEFGPATLSACLQVAVCMGISKRGYRDLRKGTVNRSVQRLIRGRPKTVRERAASLARRKYRRKLRARFDTSGGEKVMKWAKSKVGTTESPAGSNWGPEIGEWIKFTGYSGPVYWCGCFACYAVVKIGGAKIPTVIRLGFDGYIRADAGSHSNGLVQVGFSEARAGDIVVYTYPHIELVDRVEGDVLSTIGGNTSPDSGGSQSNGGGVFARTRSRYEVACIARPDYS